MRSTQLIVDLKKIRNNIIRIKKYLGQDVAIMPIIKSFAYGTNLNCYPEILEEFEYVGVAYLDEAIELRKNGYKNNILILYPLSKEEFELSKKYDFILNGSNVFSLLDENDKVKVHLEIETGMGRTGLQLDCIEEWEELVYN